MISYLDLYIIYGFLNAKFNALDNYHDNKSCINRKILKYLSNSKLNSWKYITALGADRYYNYIDDYPGSLIKRIFYTGNNFSIEKALNNYLNGYAN